MSLFNIISTPLSGLKVVQRKVTKDHRGFFSRLYCDEEFRAFGVDKSIVQVNHSLTRKIGAVRGLHFQYPPHAEIKLVNCLKGEIWDVAVDLRSGSPTYLQWYGEILSATNNKSLLIPEGFAHGFQALSEDCELIYFHTAAYQAEAEGALNVEDPQLNIEWPLAIADLSQRDRSHPFIEHKRQEVVL